MCRLVKWIEIEFLVDLRTNNVPYCGIIPVLYFLTAVTSQTQPQKRPEATSCRGSLPPESSTQLPRIGQDYPPQMMINHDKPVDLGIIPYESKWMGWMSIPLSTILRWPAYQGFDPTSTRTFFAQVKNDPIEFTVILFAVLTLPVRWKLPSTLKPHASHVDDGVGIHHRNAIELTGFGVSRIDLPHFFFTILTWHHASLYVQYFFSVKKTFHMFLRSVVVKTLWQKPRTPTTWPVCGAQHGGMTTIQHRRVSQDMPSVTASVQNDLQSAAFLQWICPVCKVSWAALRNIHVTYLPLVT